MNMPTNDIKYEIYDALCSTGWDKRTCLEFANQAYKRISLKNLLRKWWYKLRFKIWLYFF